VSKSLTWRGAIALLAILVAVVYLVPSITGEVPAWWSNILPKDKIRLGLDLQGGMHLVLEVQAAKAIENHLERVVDEMKGDLRKDKIRYVLLKRKGLDGVMITLMRSKDETVFRDMVSANYPDFSVESMPEQNGRPVFQLVLDPKAKIHIMKMAVEQAWRPFETGSISSVSASRISVLRKTTGF
jgi:preprotein translocase subunit SecD